MSVTATQAAALLRVATSTDDLRTTEIDAAARARLTTVTAERRPPPPVTEELIDQAVTVLKRHGRRPSSLPETGALGRTIDRTL